MIAPGDDDDNYKGDEDKMLWAYVTRDVKPLAGREDKKAPVPEKAPRKTVKKRRAAGEDSAVPEKKRNTGPQGREVDRRTDEKARRGRMRIEGRIDLHGLTQDEAREKLRKSLFEAYEQGRRFVLIITGKGLRGGPEGGVLKRRTPEWLNEKPLDSIVLQIYPARAQDGGEGALYVLLRRKRQ